MNNKSIIDPNNNPTFATKENCARRIIFIASFPNMKEKKKAEKRNGPYGQMTVPKIPCRRFRMQRFRKIS